MNTFPTKPVISGLEFDDLLPVLPGDYVYFTTGSEDPDTVDSKFANQTVLATTMAAFVKLGELTETPGNFQSALQKHRTRNYIIPGKRTNTYVISIAGLFNAQKEYLESDEFSNKEISILILSRDHTQALLFNGLSWKFDWNAETDTISTGTLTAENIGSSEAYRIYPDIPVASGGGGT